MWLLGFIEYTLVTLSGLYFVDLVVSPLSWLSQIGKRKKKRSS